MAITATPSARQGGSYTLLGQTANNLAFQIGTIAMDSSYSGAGESLTFTGFSTVVGAMISPQSGYVFEYDVSAEKVYVYGSDSGYTAPAKLTQIATATSLASLSQVPYIAWGYV